MKRKLFLMITIAFIISILFCTTSNNGSTKKNIGKDNCPEKIENSKDSIKRAVLDAEDIILDSIFIKPSGNETSALYINKAIEQLLGSTLRGWVNEQGISYPPQYILFRAFKLEREFEIWGSDSSNDSLKLIKIIRICAVDDSPGPKLIQGDGKTPEGFYTANGVFGSSYWFMWLKLNRENIDRYGQVGNGSSFKLCVNYPNPADIQRTAKYSKNSNPGGEICIHGNCVTAGCISFKNRAFLPVYYFAANHNKTKFGLVNVYIFPCRFDEADIYQYYKNYDILDSAGIVSFWNNIKEGYELFEKTSISKYMTNPG
ncbi:MAG: hypothetical protein HY738_00565 [Bacteroidia bacterium]|nr:hypothetical protein [Bacteroidia bacterium]